MARAATRAAACAEAPWRGSAAMLRALDRKRTPLHITPVARAMVEAIADALPAPKGAVLRRAARSRARTTQRCGCMGEQGRTLEATLRNTVNATIVRGGAALNVIPSEIEVEIDGRLLPGFGPDDLLGELRDIVGERHRARGAAPRRGPGGGRHDVLRARWPGVMRELDPDGVPVPMLLPAVTDARHLSPLGIQTYGFMPLKLPDGLSAATLAHAADERVPADAVASAPRRSSAPSSATRDESPRPRRDAVPRPCAGRRAARRGSRADALQPRTDEPGAVPRRGEAPRRPLLRPLGARRARVGRGARRRPVHARRRPALCRRAARARRPLRLRLQHLRLRRHERAA